LQRLKDINDKLHADTMSENDTENLKSAIGTYTKAFHEVSEKLYAQANAARQDAEPSDYGPDHGQDNNDTIDGDYKEV